MAKSKSKSEAGELDNLPDDVAGWDDHSTGGGDAFYAVKGPGKVIRGTVKGYKPSQKKGQTGKYMIELSHPADAIHYTGEGENREKEEVEAEKGDIVQVDETKALESLRDMVGREVFIRYNEKVDLDNGTFWKMTLKVKPAAKPDDNDIPF